MITALIIVGVVAAILALAWTRPDTIHIQRQADVKASPERIFELVNDFHHWGAWAPQDKMDPTMTRTYHGSASGRGAVSEWTSKGRAGCGRMEITESLAPARVTVQVDFVRPFTSRNINEFTLEPTNDLTKVTWAMHGSNPYIVKVMSLFFNMNRMFGKHFEAGLGNLKLLAEQEEQKLA